MKKLLKIPATLAVMALTLPGCPQAEPEEHEHETCFCELPSPRDAGNDPDASTADSGCIAPMERACVIV